MGDCNRLSFCWCGLTFDFGRNRGEMGKKNIRREEVIEEFGAERDRLRRREKARRDEKEITKEGIRGTECTERENRSPTKGTI